MSYNQTLKARYLNDIEIWRSRDRVDGVDGEMYEWIKMEAIGELMRKIKALEEKE